VSLIGVVTAVEPIMMVVDLMARGSLLKILRTPDHALDKCVDAACLQMSNGHTLKMLPF
jgi:hypothetical protein